MTEDFKTENNFDFGKNLTRVLGALEMSQIELSERTGLTPAAISQLLSGKRIPSLNTIVKILKVIPVDFSRLVTYK